MSTATSQGGISADINFSAGIAGLFERQAAKTPDASAVTFGDDSLSYRELNEQANQLAWRLRSLGAGPETLVALAVERSLAMVSGLLGVLKSGAAYVPIDPSYPPQRVSYMLRDAGVHTLLTQEHLRSQLTAGDSHVLCLDSGRPWDDRPGNTQNPGFCTGGASLAYVIYTSGSTGHPKGAMNTQAAVINRILWMQQAYRLAGDDRILQKTPFSFDVSVWEFFWPLLVGAHLVVAKPGGHQDTGYLVKTINRWSITTIHFVPSMLKMFLEEPEVSTCQSLRRVICSGEALPIQLKEAFFEKLDCELHNLYGPTETAIDVTSWECRKKDGTKTVPIGYPISNTQIYILDDELRSAGRNASGEIYIGGAGVGRGYWNRAALTAERFVPNPFAANPGDRLYRTGDLGRFMADGSIEYLGRQDAQVKIKGFRIELGEVEAALLSHEGVAGAAVAAYEVEGGGDKYLVGYIVPREHCSHWTKGSIATQMRGHLRKQLPEYMTPSIFLLLDKLPLSPNGKVDRKALRPPSGGPAQNRAPYVKPCTETERRVAELWEKVLRIDKVGRDDNFFDLGGHSLLATQLLARVRCELGVDLPVPTLFASPTVEKLSIAIEQKPGGAQAAEGPHPVARDIELPLSFSQERVWFIDQIHPGNLAYNFQALLRFEGTFSLTALQRALQEIICRHEIFRTTCKNVDGRPVQAIHATYQVELPCIDLQNAEDPLAEARRAIQRELQTPFDLEQLPLICWTVFRVRSDVFLLLHKEHHLIHDGWSFNLFLNELLELYRAYSTGAEPRLAALPVQFADFSVWQREWMRGPEAQRQLEFWKGKLSGSPTLLELPWDSPRPSVPTYKGEAPRLEIPVDLCLALRNVCREEKITLFVAMYTTFLVLLYRMSGAADICIGSGIANRRWKETEHVIGMVVNNVVLRSDLSEAPTLGELLQRNRQLVLDASANQDIPFDQVVEALHPRRDPSINPLFQVMFSFHDSPIADLDAPGASVELTETLSNRSAKWDLNVIAIPRAEQKLGESRNEGTQGITVVWEYSSDLFREETMQRWTGIYTNLLRSIARNQIDVPIDRLPLLSDREQEALTVERERRVHGRQESLPGSNLSASHLVDSEAIYVLDPNLRLVPPGVVGEVYFSDEPGYQAERFRRTVIGEPQTNPFGLSGGSIHRTTDFGRYRSDYTVQIITENVDSADPRKYNCGDPLGSIAIRIVSEQGDADAEEMKLRPAFAADEAEQTIAALWSGLLDEASPNINESFFDAGGHSLLLMRLVSAINAAFQVKLPMREVLLTPTIANLAQLVHRAMRGGRLHEKPFVRLDRSVAPASLAQAQLWFLNETIADPSAYNMPVAHCLTGDLDVAALEASVNEIVRRHGILRTRFDSVDGEVCQIIEREIQIRIEREDFFSGDKPRGDWYERLRQEARRPFDLRQASLFRLRLFRLAPEKHVLLIVMHHIVSDGWSLGVFYRELERAYAAHCDGAVFTSSEAPLQYADFASWQREMLLAGEFDDDLRYWAKKLAGAPESLTPGSRQARQTNNAGWTERFEFDQGVTRRLMLFSREAGLTLSMTLLAVYALLLARAGGQREVVIGVPSANRFRESLQTAMGFMANMLPIRIDLDGNPTFAELAGRVKSAALEAYAHQELPFERVVQELNPERRVARNPVFQAAFNMLADAGELRLARLSSSAVDVDIDSAKFELYLEIQQRDGWLRGRLILDRGVFEESSGKEMCFRFQHAVEQALSRGETRIQDLDLLLPEERLRFAEQQRIEDLEESFLL